MKNVFISDFEQLFVRRALFQIDREFLFLMKYLIIHELTKIALHFGYVMTKMI